MALYVVGKLNNWSTGQDVGIYVPNNPVISLSAVTTIPEAIAQYGESFDYESTFYMKSGTLYNYMQAYGFPHIVLVTEVITYYFSENVWIRLDPNTGSSNINITYNNPGAGVYEIRNTIGTANANEASTIYGFTANHGLFAPYNTIEEGPTTPNLNFVWRGRPKSGDTLYVKFWSTIEPVTPPPADTDPYSPDGNTEPGGGGGAADPSEDITDPSLPTISAVDTGFITLFKPSISNLNSLATYMWSGGFDIDTFKKIMANPMDAILGLSILPGIVPSGGSSTVVIGNVSTGVSMPKVGNQYVKFNCGSKTIKRKWNAFLDYSPYTRAYIYLPYIGIHPLEVDDIMNKSVTVKYNIDVLSGGCTAFVIAGGTTLYTFTGQCACSVPVTGRDWTTLINGVLGAVTGTVGAIGSAMVGNLPGAIAGAASVAQNVLSSKPTIERSGSMGGMAGMMAIRTPYIIIERPVQAVPGKQNKYIGYPSFVTKKLGDVSGYTQAEVTHLEAIPATLAEQEEIKTIIEEGVIL